MPTRTEAAQALYEAAELAITSVRPWNWAFTDDARGKTSALRAALDAYRDSTPDALPAEVARVVEAACRHMGDINRGIDFASDAQASWRDLASAVAAYRRSTQPDPLPARLARLRPGSVVLDEHGDQDIVILNEPEKRLLVVGYWRDGAMQKSTASYDYITAILSEAP